MQGRNHEVFFDEATRPCTKTPYFSKMVMYNVGIQKRKIYHDQPLPDDMTPKNAKDVF